MSAQDTGKYITRPSVIILFLICVFIYYALPSGNNLDEPSEVDIEPRRRVKKRHDSSQQEEDLSNKEKAEQTPNEFILGTKRYKLYEKKLLNFKKAEAFCKKHDGKLARTNNMEEMQRLQMLLMKARMVSDEMWIGVNKKEWKKHAWKMQQHPGGINPEALEGMNAMMMGGGKQEMCPALSSSTRALAPAMCLRELPFVCEFDRFPTPKPKSGTKMDYGKEKKIKSNKEKSQNKFKSTMRPPRKMNRKSKVEM